MPLVERFAEYTVSVLRLTRLMLVGQALDKVREKFGEEAGVKSFRMIGMPQAASFST